MLQLGDIVELNWKWMSSTSNHGIVIQHNPTWSQPYGVWMFGEKFGKIQWFTEDSLILFRSAHKNSNVK